MHSLSFSLVARWHRRREWSYTPSVVNGNLLFSHLNTDYNIIYHNPLILSSTFLLLLWLLPTQAVQAFSLMSRLPPSVPKDEPRHSFHLLVSVISFFQSLPKAHVQRWELVVPSAQRSQQHQMYSCSTLPSLLNKIPWYLTSFTWSSNSLPAWRE